jgi:hypothetical protein
MRKFEGNINGKIYTDENEFDKALTLTENDGDVYVSYKYVSVPDDVDVPKLKSDRKNEIECCKNNVSENEYVKTITSEEDAVIDAELAKKIVNAYNRSDIKDTVNKKITYFENKISNNLLHINDLKSDYKSLEEKIKLIENQIKTLDNANNNYYLNKEYYTNIRNLLDTEVSSSTNDDCGCNKDMCSCGCVYNTTEDSDKTLSIKDMYKMSPYDLAKYLSKKNICTLSDLVDYFIKNY